MESAAAPGAWLSFRDGRCHERIALQPSSAVGLAAVLSGKLKLADRPNVLVLTGRNIDAAQYLELVGPPGN